MGYTSPESRKAWKEANRDKVAAHNRASYERHRERRLAQQREYQEREAEAISARRKAAYAADPDKYKAKALKARHGLTRDEYEELLANQGGGCAVCDTTNPGGRSVLFHVDHDHTCCGPLKSCSNCRRGLLCSQCNVGIGMLADDPDRLRKAADYLMKGGE